MDVQAWTHPDLGSTEAKKGPVFISVRRQRERSVENWLDVAHLLYLYACRPTVQFSCSVMSDSATPMDCSTPGLPVHHQLSELTQTHVHWVGDAIQPSHPLLSPSPPAFNLSHHQGLFQWVSSLHQVTKVLEFQLQHQSFQWIFRTDFL